MTLVSTVSRVYLILALAVSASISGSPHSVVAALLLVPQVYSVFRLLRPGVNLAFVFLTLVLLPLTLEPAIGEFFAALLMVPGIPLLDNALRDNAMPRSLPSPGRAMRPSAVLISLTVALLLTVFVSFIPEERTLTWTSLLLIAYLCGLVTYVLWSVPRVPLEGSRTRLRVIAGNTARTQLMLTRKGRRPLHLLLGAPYPWVRVAPSRIELRKGEAIIDLAITPPLSGPSALELPAFVADPWGLIHTRQTLEAVELHVIPRARYAAWLAKKYLERATPGVTSVDVSFPLPKRPRVLKRGVEYHSSRPYQAGDRLKDIDWKHSMKLRELIAKQYLEGPGQPGIIVANLDAEDPEKADMLAYGLIASALTLAREGIPAALALYDHKEVLAVTAAESPRQTLVRTLKLAEGITLHQSGERFLGSPDLHWLRRTVTRLDGAHDESSRKLVDILRAEYEALQQAAGFHPAARALTEAAERTRPPALIVVISRSADDAEALAVSLERLRKRGYDSLPMGTAR